MESWYFQVLQYSGFYDIFFWKSYSMVCIDYSHLFYRLRSENMYDFWYLWFSKAEYLGFFRYLDAYSVKSSKQDCTSNTSWYHYCAITKLNKQSFHQCLTESKKNQLECPQSHAIVIPQPSRGLQSSSVDQLIINMQILVAAFVFVFFSSQWSSHQFIYEW